MIFLVIAPRSNTEKADLDLEVLINEVKQAYRPYLGPRYHQEPVVIGDIGITGTKILAYCPDSFPLSDYFTMFKGKWALSTQRGTSSALVANVNSKLGRLEYSSPVWGSFAAVLGDRGTDRLYSWNTVPALETVHCAQTKEFVAFSNRPLLAALASRETEATLGLDRDYIREYLAFGYSVSGVTPFKKVQTIPPRTTLQVAGGAVALGDTPECHPYEVQERVDPIRTGVAELVDVFKSSTKRTVERSAEGQVQLRLSGGGDSRLLLGLLREHPDLKITALTQGDVDSQEVKVASELAHLAGVDHLAVSPKPVAPESWVDSLRQSIAESEGFIPSEALVAPYESAAPLEAQENLAAGQWPLFKGVLDRVANNSLERLYEALGKKNSGLLAESGQDYTQRVFQEWVASVATTNNLDLLYMHGYDLRSSRYLQPQCIQIGRESQIMYPFCDSEVAAVAPALPRTNRMRNITEFLAIEEIWPECTTVPVAYGPTFRFESAEPVPGVSGQNYDARNRAPQLLDSTTVVPNEYTDDIRQFQLTPLITVSRWVVAHDLWPELKQELEPGFANKIDMSSRLEADEVVQHFPKRAGRKMFTLYLQRVALVLLWLEGDWQK